MSEPLARAELDRVIECMLHNVASCIHTMLFRTRTTVAELKAMLVAEPYGYSDQKLGVVDIILRAEGAGNWSLIFLTDIGMVLGFDWDFKVRPIVRAQGEQATPEPPGHRTGGVETEGTK